MGNHPPGKVMQFKDGGKKLCIMLQAHAAAYKAIKAMPGKLCMAHLLLALSWSLAYTSGYCKGIWSVSFPPHETCSSSTGCEFYPPRAQSESKLLVA